MIYENGGPDVLRYKNVTDPECPDGHVVVDVAGNIIIAGIAVCSRIATIFALVGSAVGMLTGLALGANASRSTTASGASIRSTPRWPWAACSSC